MKTAFILRSWMFALLILSVQSAGMHGKQGQEPWCTDNPLCSQYGNETCQQDWVQVNCPRKCKFCGEGTSTDKPYTQLNVTVPKEMTSQLKESRKPVMVKIETEGSLAEAAREGKGNSPVVESIVLKMPSKFKAEEKAKTEQPHFDFADETGNAVASVAIEIPETAWCRDDSSCNRYIGSQCNDTWVQTNCPMKCGVCRPLCQDSPECSRYTTENCKDNNWMRENCKRKCSLCEGPCVVEDHVLCDNYTDCNNQWMVDNCKWKCGKCTAAARSSATPDGSSSQECYYDGVRHEHGERWSPGTCTPECKCDDGKIHCTVIECPDLDCKNPIKKQWKCCPECPKEEGINSRCVEAEGGNSNQTCCVFPFIYHGALYTKCIDNESPKPWCATTSNFDIDGQWGTCTGPMDTIPSAVQHAPPEEKLADFKAPGSAKYHDQSGTLTASPEV